MNQLLPEVSWLRRHSISRYLPLVAVIVLGAGLRFYNLGAEPLWQDEGATWSFAQLPLSELWGEAAVRETNPPLYYTLQKVWLIFGQSESALRSLSAIIGTLTIPLTYLLARTLGGHWLGIISAALLATSKINIQYSQEARAYALLTAAATLALWGFTHLLTDTFKATEVFGQGLLRRPSFGSLKSHANSKTLTTDIAWLAYVIGISVALYSHNTALLLPVLANVIAFIWWITTCRFNKVFFLNWSVANIIPLMLWSWWLPFIVKQTKTTLGDFWIPPTTAARILDALKRLYGYSVLGNDLKTYFFWVLILLGLWCWRYKPVKLSVITIFIIGPLLLSILISLYRPIFITKIFIWTTIPFLILIASGILFFRNKFIILSLLTMVLIFQLKGVNDYYHESHKEPWNQIASYVSTRVEKNDLILIFPSSSDVIFQYYFQPLNQSHGNIAQHGVRRLTYNIPPLPSQRTVELSINELSKTVQSYEQVWLVSRNLEKNDPQGLVLSELGRDMLDLDYHQFSKGLEVWTFKSSDAPSGQP